MRIIFKILLFCLKSTNKYFRKVVRLFLELVRQLGIWLGDISVSLEVRGKKMVLPISHKLPIYIAEYPLYDTLLSRVSDYLRIRDGYLIMVDVGANIGDTILGCYTGSVLDRFLGIEANPEFTPYFKKNTNSLQGILLVEAFCFSGNKESSYINVQSSGGTARLSESEVGISVVKKTLDEIINEYSDFKLFNLLKIDTDGNDFDILSGSKKSVSSSLPIILLECDIFENVNYVENVVTSIKSLSELGYSTVLVYDNFGNLFSIIKIEDISSFFNALAYQIISNFGYYDLLFLSEKDQRFIEIEKAFFVQYCAKKGLSDNLQKALNL